MEDIPVPTISSDDVLIEIHKTAICGTDIHIYQWDDWAKATIPVPMTVGHEFYGKIHALGENVKGLEIGQRVSGEGHIVCGHCKNCRSSRQYLCPNTIGLGVNRPGAFAEYLSFPASNVIPLSSHITDDEASILDPFGNATHTALSFDLVGEDVLITGAGPIGIMAVAIARQAGARQVVITDVNPYRLSLAKQFGAHAVNVETTSLQTEMKKLGIVEGFGVGLEMSGNAAAFRELLVNMNCGGYVAILGVLSNEASIDWNQVVFKGLTLRGIYGRKMYETWYKMTGMLESGLDISPVITHHFPVEKYEEAFSLMASGQSGKVILDWV